MLSHENLAKLLDAHIGQSWAGTAEELLVFLWDRGLQWLPPNLHTPAGLSLALNGALPHLPGWMIERRRSASQRLLWVSRPLPPTFPAG